LGKRRNGSRFTGREMMKIRKQPGFPVNFNKIGFLAGIAFKLRSVAC
jgi:hypothetical protein